MIGQLLDAIAEWSWYVETTLPSILLFGESPYPNKEDYA